MHVQKIEYMYLGKLRIDSINYRCMVQGGPRKRTASYSGIRLLVQQFSKSAGKVINKFMKNLLCPYRRYFGLSWTQFFHLSL